MDRSGQGWASTQTCTDGSHRLLAVGAHASEGVRGRVLVVEEHGLLAEGMQLALARRCWHAETATGPTPADVVDQARLFEPDVALIDVSHGFGSSIGNGIELVRPLRSTGARVVMLTAERRRTALAEFLEAGAAGWVRKTAGLEEVDSTLARVAAGESIIGRAEREALLDRLRNERVQARRAGACFDQLTHREALVLAALVDGLSADEIAREHVVAVTTVRSQIRAVLNKLGVRSQLAAVAAVGNHRALLPQRGDTVRDRRRLSTPETVEASGETEHIA